MPAAAPTTVKDRLAAHGHRLTLQRMIVASELARTPHTVSAQELYDSLRVEHPLLGRATVFRTLDFLVENGLAQRFEAEGHIHVYTSCADNHHHHLVCRICASTTEIDDTAVDQLIDAVRGGYGFALDHAALDFYGTCAACAAAITGP
ncbi:MAG: Fur family transcriptional regulator [Candidatus Dormiibacterota bacterium]